MKKLLFFISMLVCCCVTYAKNTDQQDIQQAGINWATAIKQGDPEKISALYNKNAFLYATFSNILDTPQQIREYFIKLVKHPDLAVTFDRQHIRIYHGPVAINSGTYTFSYIDQGKKVFVPGRYTFVYLKTANQWSIIDHHSSVMPEK